MKWPRRKYNHNRKPNPKLAGLDTIHLPDRPTDCVKDRMACLMVVVLSIRHKQQTGTDANCMNDIMESLIHTELRKLENDCGRELDEIAEYGV